MKSSIVPGLLLLLLIAFVSTYASELVVMGGKHPLEASALAVVLGILLRNLGTLPEICKPGVKQSEKLLAYGIVLMGAGLDVRAISSQGGVMLCIVVVTMAVGFWLIYYLGKLFKLPENLAMLLAVGTTICGTSAIAVTAPLIQARDEETSYAVGTVALWGLVAILLYPYLGILLHANDLQFGVFAGTAIHSTPQVVGAGFIFSDAAGKTASAVKLVRNCFMAPIALLIALAYSKKLGSGAAKVNIMKAFPWYLFGYFAMAALNTYGVFSPEMIDKLSSAGKFLILLGMSGVGLSTDFQAFRQVGFRPLLVGLIASIIVAAVSVSMITTLL